MRRANVNMKPLLKWLNIVNAMSQRTMQKMEVCDGRVDDGNN